MKQGNKSLIKINISSMQFDSSSYCKTLLDMLVKRWLMLPCVSCKALEEFYRRL